MRRNQPNSPNGPRTQRIFQKSQNLVTTPDIQFAHSAKKRNSGQALNSCNDNKLQNPQNSSGAESGASVAKNNKNQAKDLPDDLLKIVEIWPSLPEHIKAAINALVQTRIKGDQK